MVEIGFEALTTLSVLLAGRALLQAAPRHDQDVAITKLAWSVAYGTAATIVTFGLTSLLRANRPSILLLPPLIAIIIASRRRGLRNGAVGVLRAFPWLLAAAVGSSMTAVVLRLGGYTGDTFQLIASARALAQNLRGPAAVLGPSDFESFPPGYSLLQIPSAWTDHTANHGLGVLLACSILVLLAHALRSSPRPTPALAVLALIGLLASTHFFWVMTTYINSHAAVALLLLTAYLGLSASSGALRDDLPVLLGLASLVVLRVENLLLLALLLTTPIGFGPGSDPGRLRSLRAALGVTAATGLAHQGLVILLYRAADQRPSSSSLGLVAVAVGLALVAILAPRLARVRILPIRWGWVLPALLAANAAWAVLDLRGFAVSSLATAQNLFAWSGGWGILPPLLLGLAIAAALVGRLADGGRSEILPLLTFCLAAALLLFFTGFLREEPFRLGAGDSLNRQLFHVVPLCLLALGRAIGSVAEDRRG